MQDDTVSRLSPSSVLKTIQGFINLFPFPSGYSRMRLRTVLCTGPNCTLTDFNGQMETSSS